MNDVHVVHSKALLAVFDDTYKLHFHNLHFIVVDIFATLYQIFNFLWSLLQIDRKYEKEACMLSRFD